ncbi:MAG: bifunctional nicotinamidase/pyrazinamidase [Alphaproteobacteria bacterium]
MAADAADEVLLVVDMQNDFCAGGALAVPDADAIVPPVNGTARRFAHVVLTQDWHPAGHSSFASRHPGRLPFDTVAMSYGPQVLWPDHCVQGTPGAAFHPGLDIPHAALVLRKGHRPAIDSYSAFFENDRRTPTGLAGYLRERGLGRVVVCGLALDFCVAFSAVDARRLGFEVTVLAGLCRAIDIGGSLARAMDDMAAAGVRLVDDLDGRSRRELV